MTSRPYAYPEPAVRRHPLSNANANHYVNAPRMGLAAASTAATAGKQYDRAQDAYKIAENAPRVQSEAPTKASAPPGSPPLPRQNTKTTPPSPPRIISDKSNQFQLHRVGFLGEGGFARVYEVLDNHRTRMACKVVTKASLKTKKAKTKLYAEIKIHRSLTHPNIVGFQDCFEDDENVYITLELCQSGSLMDMLRRRRRFTEPEARYFMVQLIGACYYMHSHQVIHRDLKLGNLFLDGRMNVKVGDFGLAALIETPGERKKTVCGTPNYIAPEVLFDRDGGHSFEVDIWSIGVILYTLVVGRPPFQTKDVKEIYARIRDNKYEFPEDKPISDDARELVQKILASDPAARPALYTIVDHPFFTFGEVPDRIPVSAQDQKPDFARISRTQSAANLARLRRQALLDEDQITAAQISLANTSIAPTDKGPTAVLAQQEKEFHKAVQPGSPISALLNSARQPLVMGAMGGPSQVRDSPLLRKVQTAAGKEAMRMRELRGIADEATEELKAAEARRKGLEAQKARIVAQMAPQNAGPATAFPDDVENIVPSSREVKGKDRADEAAPASAAPSSKANSLDAPLSSPKPSGFEAAAQTLTQAFEARAQGRVFRDPRDEDEPADANVFIVSWVDYCNKYGMGYALTDGSVGVHFNDSTTIVLSPDKHHFDYITFRRHGAVYVRKNYTVADYPDDLKNKVYLLRHFEMYIMDHLYGDYDFTFEDTSRVRGMDFVQKYLRMKHVIVFKMSHDVLQFNFYDHSKVILSNHGLFVTHIDKNYKLTQWRLSDIIARSLSPAQAHLDPDEAKFNGKLLDKLKYCKEVLLSIRNASGGSADDGAPRLASADSRTNPR